MPVEIFIVLLFLGMVLMLGFGYLIMSAARNSFMSAKLHGANDRATMLGERYMLQAAMARRSMARQNE